MTFSIVARSDDGTAWGVAVASKYLAAGAAVPAAEAAVGAIATQSFVNRAYRPQGLALLRDGLTAADTLDALVAADDGRDQRQAGIVDAKGQSATFTGAACMPWAGGLRGEGYAIQGNILEGPEVVADMEAAWVASGPADRPDLPPLSLARRLFAALVAGDAAGGDRRGRQSAAILVVDVAQGVGLGADVAADLRVDDHPAPMEELARLLDLHDLYFGKPDPATILPLEGALAAEVARLVARTGFATLDEWAGVENYEERLIDGGIDPLVLDKLRKAGA